MFFSVGYILNVTREIDNFFPESFNYMNIRVYDVEATDLLSHWPATFNFINTARYQRLFKSRLVKRVVIVPAGQKLG